MAYVLDRNDVNSVFTGDLKLVRHHDERAWTDINLPRGGRSNQLPADFAPYLNTHHDVFAPGVREQMPDPSRPNLGPYRSNLYQRNDTNVNNNPVVNYDEMTPSWLMSPWHQRYASAWHDVLRETPVREHWLFRDWGQWNTPYTGFSALKDLKPRSTLGWTI